VSEPLLELTGISKQYPGCLANDGIDLRVAPGEIHALLGENGAGKSTLVKIIYGVVRPDAEELRWRGERVSIASPAAARSLGIAMVFQHFALFEALSVAENVALGLDVPVDAIAPRIAELSHSYGLTIDPRATVHDLSVGERQRVEIVRCLLQQPRLLIMDEPTSVLTPSEVQLLFTTLRRLAAEGCAILYISHKLQEVRTLCERATILRAGRVVGECDPRAKSAAELAELMINTELRTPHRHTVPTGSTDAPRLRLDALTIRTPYPFGTDLVGIDLAVARGEIVGIAGVAGNGQSELMDALSGEIAAGRPQNIAIDGLPVGHLGPAERRARGACFVPEDRNGHSAVASMSLAGNTFLSSYVRASLSRFGMIQSARTRARAREIIERFGVRTTGPQAPARSLSGGNLQKFLIGREVLLQPSVLVISQPTWGVDVGAATAIHEALLRLAEAGTCIVVISQDLDELMALSDRVAVLAGGRLSAPMARRDATAERIGVAMGHPAAANRAHA
jgi:simple sugar transport system ATP-binding protein